MQRINEIIHKYKLLIFDFDLTLADTRLTAEFAYDSALTACGSVFDKKKLFEFLSESLEASYSKIARPLISVEEFKHIFDSKIHESILDTTVFYDDAIKFIVHLNNLDKKLAIVTNKDRESINMILSKYELSNYFSTLICAEDVNHKKPHKEPIVACLSRENILPADAVYFGDALNDLLCAQNSHVNFVYINRYNQDSLLQDNIITIHSFDDIKL